MIWFDFELRLDFSEVMTFWPIVRLYGECFRQPMNPHESARFGSKQVGLLVGSMSWGDTQLGDFGYSGILLAAFKMMTC